MALASHPVSLSLMPCAILRSVACLALGGSLAGCGGGGGGFTGIPAELIPNLRPQKASNFSIQHINMAAQGSHRALRLTTKVSNYGEGPLELFGNIVGANPDDPVPATQVIRWNNGDRTILPAGEFHFHPEHNHWHWQNFVSFRLHDAVSPDDPYDPSNTLVAENQKVSFCLIDTEKIPGFAGPGQPSTRRYATCNGNTQGISVGWTDVYAASLPGQWIVIDGVPDGQYWVILESDPEGLLLELDETDNRSAVKIQITGNSVTVLP